jgi:hypothetical protein
MGILSKEIGFGDGGKKIMGDGNLEEGNHWVS